MTKSNRIIKLKLDVIFKAMFGKKGNEKILADFLSRLLEIPRQSIKRIIIENVELLPENFGDKFSRVDLKLQVDKRIVNVEMQICSEEYFEDRSTYYWAKIFSGDLKSGEDYGKLKETICINIIDFNLFDCKEFHSHFKIMEKDRHEVLTDKFGIHFFELKKIGKNPNKNNLMEMWLQLINTETEEELSMLENTNVQEINDAILILKDLNADEHMRYISEMREKALHDEATALNSAEKRGVEKGMKDGIKKGRAEGRVSRESEIAKNLRKMGMTEEQIKKALEM